MGKAHVFGIFPPGSDPLAPQHLDVVLRFADPCFVQCWKVEQTNTPSTLQDVNGVLRAALFAAEKHAQQRRKGAAAEPYINHLLEVAQLVAGSLVEPDTHLVIAALLHDTVEDTGTTVEELTSQFGSDVANLVSEVTDDKSLPKQERKRLQIDNAPKKSERAQAIKLADKISNVRSILSSPPADWNEERKSEYFKWASQVVEALTAPNPALKAEFRKTVSQFVREDRFTASADECSVFLDQIMRQREAEKIGPEALAKVRKAIAEGS